MIIVVSDWSFVVGKKIDLVSERNHANIPGRGTTSVGWMAYKGDGPWCRLVAVIGRQWLGQKNGKIILSSKRVCYKNRPLI